MNHHIDINGHQNVVIQGVTDSAITVQVNGETQEIRNELVALKMLLEKQESNTFQAAQSIYNIAEITEANFGFVLGKKAFNIVLTKRLINALQPYSRPAERFLEKATRITPDWESQPGISDTAKDIIAVSFVGVLGIQLRKLMAIGKEDFSYTKQRKYIENCLITSKRTLQLLCFSLISKLWDYKKNRNIEFTARQTEDLSHFFNDEFERDIKGYLFLLQNLYAIFQNYTLNFPILELKEFASCLHPQSDFTNAFKQLHAINELLDQSKFTLLTCFDAETQMTIILENLAFLSLYKMVSIKSIGYDEMRNAPPRYLHHYAALGIDSKFNVNSEKVNYVEDTISTDAILLFKGQYQESVNLFPFIIDLNSLTFENGTKICFYTAKDFADGSLNYRFLEDNGIENIVFSNILNSGFEINELMMDKEKKKKLKLDAVFLQFQEARKMLLGINHTDDLANIFDDEQHLKANL